MRNYKEKSRRSIKNVDKHRISKDGYIIMKSVFPCHKQTHVSLLESSKKNYNKHICNESNCHEKFSLNIFRECLCRSPIETKVRPVFYKKGLFKNPLFTFLANFVFVVSHLKILPAVHLNTLKALTSLQSKKKFLKSLRAFVILMF